MGQVMVRLALACMYIVTNASQSVVRKSNQKRRNDSTDESNVRPSKKRSLEAAQHLCQSLSDEEKHSNINITALGKTWNLQKIHLAQSEFIWEMIKDTRKDVVHINISDKLITPAALDIAFRSMYLDSVEINPNTAVPVLATASLLRMEDLLEKCAKIMVDTFNDQNVIYLYDIACQYKIVNLKRVTFAWLETNLSSAYCNSVQLLLKINSPLMIALVRSPNLYVKQSEMSIYMVLRKWMYLKLHPRYKQPAEINSFNNIGANDDCSDLRNDIIQNYFRHCSRKPFLTSPEGESFLPAFQVLRIQHMILHQQNLIFVLMDNIIPRDWLRKHILSNWKSILEVDHGTENGPQVVEPEFFFKHCARYGCTLYAPNFEKWCWSCFNFGIDLQLTCDGQVLQLKRVHHIESRRLLSLREERQLMICIRFTSVNLQRKPVSILKTNIAILTLKQNQEVTLVEPIDPRLTYPLLVTVNMLVVACTGQDEQMNNENMVFC